MLKTIIWLGIACFASVIVAALFGFGWWGVFFRNGLLLPDTVDISDAIWIAGIVYVAAAGGTIGDASWKVHQELLRRKAGKEEGIAEMQVLLLFRTVMHIVAFIFACGLLILLAIEPRESWISGVVIMATAGFTFTFLLSIALLLSTWGPRQPKPTSALLKEFREVVTSNARSG